MQDINPETGEKFSDLSWYGVPSRFTSLLSLILKLFVKAMSDI
jgi:hypothetical protein